MKKNIAKCIAFLVLTILIIIILFNIYNCIVSGKQYIKISTASKAYTNSDLYVSIVAQDNGVDLDTNTKVKLLNSKGKTVKNVNVSYEDNNAILGIPDIEPGNYFIEAKVSSQAGKDTIQKEIYISDGNAENVTITLDKGIYKPGDTVNFRALLTSKEKDEPISKDLNISIYDGNDNKVYNENVKSSDYGIVSGSFSLASEVNSGLYKLVVNTKSSETTKQFKVNPYVVPKYEVNIDYDKENYLVGETAKISFNAQYFFGEPVQNAKLTIYLNNENYKTLETDSQGNASLDYVIKDAKKYSIKVEAVDSSNYFVEETSSFTAGTDIFEIQLFPEYGVLVSGKKNDVYVFTNKADGTPLKTYVTISSSNNFTKQIATDENGIGKFSIDIEQLTNSTNYYNSKKNGLFSITAQDIDGNTINKKITLNIEQKNLLVSTDKVKYEQGDDIKISISSLTENSKNIYMFKNDKLIKMLSTDLEDTSINLDDTYGLIDIYVTEKKGKDIYNTSYGTNAYKKTIFINPSKQLNISINTDKDEYSPGDNISVSFNTVNENNSSIDTALLVSMLDNSILSLADNDLSIDNIKLALQNINFSNELDAATLYSCLINNSSEQTLMALLLKQSSKNISVSETGMYNSEQQKKSEIILGISIVIFVVLIIIFLFIYKKTKNIMKHVINFIIYDFILIITIMCIMEEFLWRYNYWWWVLGITSIFALATYIAFVYKLNKKIFRTSISIIITTLSCVLLFLLIDGLEVSPLILLLIFAILFLILAILSRIKNIINLKMDRYIQELIYILQFTGALILSIILGFILQMIIPIDGIAIPIILVSLYFLNYLFNVYIKENLSKDTETPEKEALSKSKILQTILIVFAIIGIMSVGAIITLLVNSTSDVTDTAQSVSSGSYSTNSSSTSRADDVLSQLESNIDSASVDTSSMSKSNGGLLSAIESASDILSTNKSTVTQSNSITSETTETEAVTDNNIRNVFLESMCFIPELVTSDGYAKLDLKLSDNITTWTIQTVGNTKDGRIGYGILDNVKVFKEFFVDFELPKNLIETDKISIPVTVYNYTNNQINTTLKITQYDWFSVNNSNITLNIDANSSNMVYIPIEILKAGNNKFRVEVSSNNLTDIVEKECIVSVKGYKVEKVVSTGNLDEDISEDILILDNIIDNTAKAKIKIYSSSMSQTIEGMENIFRMPTGCFEQVSSTLYPNILALKYLEDNKIVDEEIKSKALSYISSGYQKLLTYEVKGESGGYSLYGKSPAEAVLTAYGLMELTDLSDVYSVDNTVIEKMTNFLYGKQNSNGTFTITGNHLGGASSRETLSLNAYITWALSESNANDSRLNKSVDYLKGKLDDIDDNYTLALVANILANVKDKELNNVLKRLVNNVNINGNNAYLTSNIVDYYGSRGNIQTVQTVALTSIALSKGSYNPDTNKLLINYLISKKDYMGTWYNTQATILTLKAINEINNKAKLENQTITVKINSDEQKIEIKDNPLSIYELTFENLSKENKLNIDIENGNAYYEVIEEYYIPYEKVNTENDNIEILVESNNNLKVNEILQSNIKVINRSDSNISNGMVTISIPQGFTVIENSLMLLESKGIIEKYEMSYSEIIIYLRNFSASQVVNLDVSFRASYPVEITGLSVKAYDYYNPDVEGKTLPIEISVKE